MADTPKLSTPWRTAVLAAAIIWLIGSYLPSISNYWAQLNLIAPAGQTHLLTLPLAFPKVGVDLSTLCSLLGALIIIGAVVRWFTYLQFQTPEPITEAGLSRPRQTPPPG